MSMDFGSGHPLYDPGYSDVQDDGPSIGQLMSDYYEGRYCGECACEFTKANGKPSCCEHCKNQGSELPLSKYPEKNREAHKAQARQRRKNRRASK